MNKLIPDKPLRACVTTVSLLIGLSAQPRQVEKYDILPTQPRQHIQHFGASDAWSMRFIGLWPEWQQNQVADWLFSTENDAEGKPKGIGLSIWRFNLGAGSAEQGDSSHINYPTRTECVLRSDGSYDWSRQAGQRRFLKLAKRRGVPYLLAFCNSAPVYFTKNGLATNTGRDSCTDPNGVMCSAYRNTDGKWVVVAINYSEEVRPVEFSIKGSAPVRWTLYRTSDTSAESLAPLGASEGTTLLAPRSITTFVEP